MKVIVFGATGGLGQHVWRGAIDEGHEVVAFVRSPGKLDATDARYSRIHVIQGDAMDGKAIRAAAEGCDVAINCTSPAGGNATIELAQSVVGHSAEAGVKAFYMVGGMGALWAPGAVGKVLIQDWDDAEAMARYGFSSAIPRDTIRGMTKGHLASMAFMETTGLPHSFICPGMMVEGPPAPSPVVTLDELGGRAAMRVPYANVAQTIVGDLDTGALLGHRVCVSPE